MVDRLILVPFLKLNGTKVAQIKIFKIRDLCNPLERLAHPAGVEPATLSTAN